MSFEITTRETYQKITDVYSDIFNSPGRRSKEVKESLKDIDETDPVVMVNYDGAKVAVGKNGNEIGFEKGQEPDAVNVQLRGVPGSVPGNKMIDGVMIPCGLCAIVGVGNTGKSPLSHALASYGDKPYAIVRVGEPLSGYASTKHESALDLARAMIMTNDVVLDSIKDVISSGSGAAMKSGINRDALTAVSTWSAQACDLGTTLFVPINPSTSELGVVQMIAEAAKSNATSCLINLGGEEWEFFARTGEGMERTHAVLKFTRDGQLSFRKVNNPGDVDVSSRITTLVVDQANNMNALIERVYSEY